MDMLVELISTVGFPVVACGALFWFVNKQEERRTEELEGMRNALNENTQILTALKELINMIVNKDNE